MVHLDRTVTGMRFLCSAALMLWRLWVKMSHIMPCNSPVLSICVHMQPWYMRRTFLPLKHAGGCRESALLARLRAKCHASHHAPRGQLHRRLSCSRSCPAHAMPRPPKSPVQVPQKQAMLHLLPSPRTLLRLRRGPAAPCSLQQGHKRPSRCSNSTTSEASCALSA